MATNKLKFGTETPSKLYMGDTEITKAYMGETLVYETSGQDELAGTWVFNDRLFGSTLGELLDIEFVFNFDSSGSHYVGIAISQSTRTDNEIAFMVFDDNESVSLHVYSSEPFDENETTGNRWLRESFKTITITSKLSEVTNGDMLLTWLRANAVKQ